MTDLAKRVAGPTQLPITTAADAYVVPGATQLIVRHIHFFNGTAGSVSVTASVGADAAATRFLDAFPIAAHSPYDWIGFLVLEAGEEIEWFASAATAIVGIINGILVT